MNTENYIIASCMITGNTVHKNGAELFTGTGMQANEFFVSLYKYLNIEYPRFYKMDSLSKLGWLASEVLLKDNFNTQDHQPEQTGLVLFNANASLDTDVKYLETVKEIASPSVFVYTLPNIMIGEICIRNRFKGESAFFIADEPDPFFMHQYVNGLLNDHILNTCICGWVDLFEQEYKAVLFLVEKKEQKNAPLFSIENIKKSYHPNE